MDQAQSSGTAYMRASIDAMQGASSDDRRTVRALAREVHEDTQDGELHPL
jgi:hypothetical protein